MIWSCGLQFRVRSGPDRGSTHPIDSPVVKIGRASQPGERQAGWIKIPDDKVSRLHCELFWQEDRRCFRLLHRSTTNSTYVNGEAVEDAELFDGDLMEVGGISLELQKADLRWSQADRPNERDWPTRPHEAPPPSLPTARPAAEPVAIPGATVSPAARPSGVKLTIGPREPFVLETPEGEVYLLQQTRIRLGCAEDPSDSEQEANPRKKPHFDVHYTLEGADFSYYNLILRYDELYQGYKAVRVGPQAQEISISRAMGGLIWRSNFPEGVEVELHPGDLLLVGNLEFTYRKATPA